MMNGFLFFGAINCLLSVGLGAFGAHKLRESLAEESMRAFEVGVNYQMSHGLAMLFIALALHIWPGQKLMSTAAYLLTTGLVLFCGSLYILALTEVRRVAGFPVGIITPIGGSCFIAGWCCLVVAALRLPQ